MHIIFIYVEIIENCQQSIEYFIDSDQSLGIDEGEPENETIICDETDESDEETEGSLEATGESSQSESIPSSPMKRPKRMISLEDKKKAVDFWKSGKTKRLSLTKVSNRYRFVTSLPQLYDFEKQLETSGTRHDMLREVWTYTYNEFINAKNNNLIIHDWDLKRWAIKKKNEISLQNFTASNI
jgi:hypothetical protein